MVYDILTTIKNHLEANAQVNTVTFGDIMDIDLNKQSIFPLAHMLIDNATISNQTAQFSISVLCMDVAEVSKEDTRDEAEPFYGVGNEQDILNTQFYVVNDLVQALKRGDLFSDKYQLDGDPSCEPFMDRYENLLVGWSVTLSISVPNNIDICQTQS
jgi:hypothetical protein